MNVLGYFREETFMMVTVASDAHATRLLGPALFALTLTPALLARGSELITLQHISGHTTRAHKQYRIV